MEGNFVNELARRHQEMEMFGKNRFATVIKHLAEEMEPIIWVCWNSSSCPQSYRETETLYHEAFSRIDVSLRGFGYVLARHKEFVQSVYVKINKNKPLCKIGDFSLLSLPVRSYDGSFIAYAIQDDRQDIITVSWDGSINQNADYIDEEHLSELSEPHNIGNTQTN